LTLVFRTEADTPDLARRNRNSTSIRRTARMCERQGERA
jgi:hypothetical protein